MHISRLRCGSDPAKVLLYGHLGHASLKGGPCGWFLQAHCSSSQSNWLEIVPCLTCNLAGSLLQQWPQVPQQETGQSQLTPLVHVQPWMQQRRLRAKERLGERNNCSMAGGPGNTHKKLRIKCFIELPNSQCCPWMGEFGGSSILYATNLCILVKNIIHNGPKFTGFILAGKFCWGPLLDIYWDTRPRPQRIAYTMLRRCAKPPVAVKYSVKLVGFANYMKNSLENMIHNGPKFTGLIMAYHGW